MIVYTSLVAIHLLLPLSNKILFNPPFADDRMKRAVKAVIGSAHAWREWTSVARELGLTERQISDIERDNPGPDRRRDCCYQTLLAWQEIHGERATRKQLLRAMKRLRFKDVAGEDITMGDSDCV